MTCSPPPRRRILSLLLASLGLLYPGLVYLALDRVPAGALALAALALVAARLGLLARGGPLAAVLIPPLALVAFATILLALTGAERAALTYPVLMSLGMASAFAWSLRPGHPCLVEHFAALSEPDPTPAARAYMRKVTVAWALVLSGNAALSGWTVLHGDPALWALYNGLLSYLLLGGTAGIEYLIRRAISRQTRRGSDKNCP